jgi:hypothetical protein
LPGILPGLLRFGGRVRDRKGNDRRIFSRCGDFFFFLLAVAGWGLLESLEVVGSWKIPDFQE